MIEFSCAAILFDLDGVLVDSAACVELKKGRAGTYTHDYERHGTTTLFAALEVATGRVEYDCLPPAPRRGVSPVHESGGAERSEGARDPRDPR